MATDQMSEAGGLRPNRTGPQYSGRAKDAPSVGASNGHDWIRLKVLGGLESCRMCGFVRRADDQNKPCRGSVKVGPRVINNATLTAICVACKYKWTMTDQEIDNARELGMPVCPKCYSPATVEAAGVKP